MGCGPNDTGGGEWVLCVAIRKSGWDCCAVVNQDCGYLCLYDVSDEPPHCWIKALHWMLTAFYSVLSIKMIPHLSNIIVVWAVGRPIHAWQCSIVCLVSLSCWKSKPVWVRWFLNGIKTRSNFTAFIIPSILIRFPVQLAEIKFYN